MFSQPRVAGSASGCAPGAGWRQGREPEGQGQEKGLPELGRGHSQHMLGIPQQLVSPTDRRNISGRISAISLTGAAGSTSFETQLRHRLTPLIR